MEEPPTPKVFLSYSHADKRVARRLLRRMTAHGIRVWIDERELRVGASLEAAIRTQIENSDTLLVVASRSSADSKWVGLELDFAREHGKRIVPFFVEPVTEHERFQSFLGVNALSPLLFADLIHELMRDLFLASGLKLPAANPETLRAGLRDLAKEEPDIAPLILDCLNSKNVYPEAINYHVAFHVLDEALDALFDLMPEREDVASFAAYAFSRAGAGARALSLWIDSTGDGQLPLVAAVGASLASELIPIAIKLLGACSPPNNHALYNFIHHNSAQLNDPQRRSVVRLVTWPVRTDTDRLADVLVWVAFKHFPECPEIQAIWTRWIFAGAFDGKASYLARFLADASKEGLAGWDPIYKALRDYVRACLRSGDKNRVMIATDHIQATADANSPVLASLLDEADGVSGTAEWNEWRKHDPDSVEWLRWYVSAVVTEARGDRNWLRAWDSAKQMVAFDEYRRRILEKEQRKTPPGSDK